MTPEELEAEIKAREPEGEEDEYEEAGEDLENALNLLKDCSNLMTMVGDRKTITKAVREEIEALADEVTQFIEGFDDVPQGETDEQRFFHALDDDAEAHRLRRDERGVKE